MLLQSVMSAAHSSMRPFSHCGSHTEWYGVLLCSRSYNMQGVGGLAEHPNSHKAPQWTAMTTYMPLLCQLLALLAASHTAAAQTTTAAAAQAPVPITNSAGAPVGGDLSLNNFEYQYGNTAGLAVPSVERDGLHNGQVAGIVVGCVLFGVLAGALGTLCWLKRKRLFPHRFGPCEHPNEAPPVGPIDVIRSGSKLDNMSKHELSSVKSFSTPV